MKAWVTFIGLSAVVAIAIGTHFAVSSLSAAQQRQRAAPAESSRPAIQTAEGAPKLWTRSVTRPSPPQDPEVTEPAVPTPEPDAEPGSDPRPRRTAADIEAELESAFQSAGPGGAADSKVDKKLRGLFDVRQIDSLECRGGRCRMELTFDDQDSAEQKLRDVFLSPDFDLDMGGTIASREVAEDGSFHARVYLYREDRDNVPPEPEYD